MAAINVRLADLPADRRYKLLVGVVIPRPIAFVTTIDADGIVNAAPYSFFNVFSENPAVVALGINLRPDGKRLKDTGANIRNTGEFVVNMVDEAHAEAQNIGAIEFEPDISELAEAGLETAPSVDVKPPRIASAPAALECKWLTSVLIGPNRELTLGTVQRIHVRDGLMDANFNMDLAAYKPIGRLFANKYAYQRQPFEVKRMTVEEWRQRQASARQLNRRPPA